MDAVHDGAPERFLIAVCEGGECTVIVVSAPDGARIIRGAACKPDVAVVGGGAGLSGDGLTGSGDGSISSSGWVRNDAAQRIGKQKRGAVF